MWGIDFEHIKTKHLINLSTRWKHISLHLTNVSMLIKTSFSAEKYSAHSTVSKFSRGMPKNKNSNIVPYMDTLRKMHFFHPCIHVIGLQKCMTTIPGLLTTFKKISSLVNVLV